MDLDKDELKATRKLYGLDDGLFDEEKSEMKDKIKEIKEFLNKWNKSNKVFVKDGKVTVGGCLYLSNTNITELPNNLTVGGNVYGFNGDRIVSIKKVLKGYNKELKYIYFDGILWGNVKSVKKVDNITIYKTPLGYCVVENELSAHGKTLKEAMGDLTFKKLRNTDNSEIIKEIKKTGKVNRAQYRAITGACQMGTEKFCQQHNITANEISLDDLRKILVNDYGAETFWNLIDEK